jgi:predicted transcriptional regulator
MDPMEQQAPQSQEKLSLISEIVSSYMRRNSIGVEQIATVIASVTRAMQDAERLIAGGEAGDGVTAQAQTTEKAEPVVSIRASVRPDYLVCLVCGAKVKTLKRHLTSAHALTPAQYRERYDLKRDYPMTAPAYSEKRSAMAKTLGLGRKAGEGRKERKATPRRGGRKKAQAA